MSALSVSVPQSDVQSTLVGIGPSANYCGGKQCSLRLQVNEMQQVARAAARILVSGPGLKEPQLLFAHSMLPSFVRPWDNVDATLTAPEGMMLWSLAEPCMQAFERFESPRVSANLGSRLGIYFQFPEPGTHSSLLRSIQLTVFMHCIHTTARTVTCRQVVCCR